MESESPALIAEVKIKTKVFLNKNSFKCCGGRQLTLNSSIVTIIGYIYNYERIWDVRVVLLLSVQQLNIRNDFWSNFYS